MVFIRVRVLLGLGRFLHWKGRRGAGADFLEVRVVFIENLHVEVLEAEVLHELLLVSVVSRLGKMIFAVSDLIPQPSIDEGIEVELQI